MRILTWNINGVRTLPQYHPWYDLKSFEAILEHAHIKSDIFCFQEMKIARSAIERSVALPGPYDAFFSLPQGKGKGGYSGVSVYVDSRTTRPLKAEEGLSGLLQPKLPLSSYERVSQSYPSAHVLDFVPDDDEHLPSDLLELDNEGRTLVMDFGLFVLINVYCPAEAVPSRLAFKINFHKLLQERVRILIEEEGREVIVVGDINICALPIDHCEGSLESKRSVWWDHPPRTWFRDWLEPNGKLIDVTRRSWPERKAMYTCWNTLISARASNYGTRIDYVLCTAGLLPWIKFSDILPDIQGSDHCPVYVDLHDEIMGPDGSVLRLKDEMKFDSSHELPRIAAKYWDEFSDRQTLVSTFFSKKGNAVPSSLPIQVSSSQLSDSLPSTTPIDTPPLTEQDAVPGSDLRPIPNVAADTSQLTSVPKQTDPTPVAAESSQSTSVPKKVKPTQKKGQMKLSSFFAAPSQPHQSKKAKKSPPEVTYDASREEEDEDDDYWAQAMSQAGASESSKAAWSSLLTPPSAPKCPAHGVQAKEYTVNKPGPNKGKRFYLCSKPVGPGYDSGRAKRPREEVDPRYRCDFFQWASDVKKNASHGEAGPSAKRPRQRM